MQKILRRVATAERAVAKRHKKQMQGRDKNEATRERTRRTQQLADVTKSYKATKQNIRDAWELGPLAAREDVGVELGTRGAIPETHYATYALPSRAQLEARCAWAGGTRFLSVAVNDRAVLIDGPDKGRIGRIIQIEPQRGEAYLEGLNKSNISLDNEVREVGENPIMTMELAIPISRIRLVHPLKDPVTGVTRDVIVNLIEPRGVIHDRYSGTRQWTRVVPGLNAVIPWPKKDEPDTADKRADTLLMDAEAKTFVPTLLRPPMPDSVIDELRGKYSRFRTRHDPEYVARLEAEDQAKRDRAKLADSIRTPLQEFHRAEREKKKRKGKPRLTIEMLEKIGEVMARNMERMRNAQALPEATGSGSAAASEAATSEVAASEAAEAAPTPLETASEETPPPPSS
ncbi:hypothetical protein F4781DRAFT_275568 [Annulohypoxylon bovei var. microspora]|nr:hypothetical protein F4781DRAFT_275568 [Annulohypoxylon bovei var. microspora]